MKKSQLQSIISKYYLDLNESVKWIIKDKTLTIDFMSPEKDMIGNIKVKDFDMEDIELPIFDTKKLINLIKICAEDLTLGIERNNQNKAHKLYIQDDVYEVIYTLSDPMLFSKVGSVKDVEWNTTLDLSSEDINNMIKAKNALSDVDNMIIESQHDLSGEGMCNFIFGDNSDYNNKITYSIKGKIDNSVIRISFNSDQFKNILSANKDSSSAFLKINKEGLMSLEFSSPDMTSYYFMVKKSNKNL